jgi:hypothetical protein
MPTVCWKHTSTKYNKYVVNQKLEHVDELSYQLFALNVYFIIPCDFGLLGDDTFFNRCPNSNVAAKYTLKANVYLLLFWWDGFYAIGTHSISLHSSENLNNMEIKWTISLVIDQSFSYISYIYIHIEKKWWFEVKRSILNIYISTCILFNVSIEISGLIVLTM